MSELDKILWNIFDAAMHDLSCEPDEYVNKIKQLLTEHLKVEWITAEVVKGEHKGKIAVDVLISKELKQFLEPDQPPIESE